MGRWRVDSEPACWSLHSLVAHSRGSAAAGDFELLSSPFGARLATSCLLTIGEEPTTTQGITGAPVTVNAALDVGGAAVTLVASGVLNAAGKDALGLALLSMRLEAPAAASSSEDIREGCDRVALSILPRAELAWSEQRDSSRLELSTGASPLAEVLLTQLFLDQDMHILCAPNAALVVLDRRS